MQGKIIKGISGFYYIHVAGSGIYECKAKGVFRNQNIKPLVGDNVEIAVLDEEHKKGNIEINQTDISFRSQHNIGRFDISMNDRRNLFMKVLKRAA